jgi:galactokinase
LLIDCRSLTYEAVPLPAGTTVVILDTATRRGLVDSAYNERRSQCEAAARFFGVPALRDVSLAQFEEKAEHLDELTRQRARHVITENERTLGAAEAMKRGDAELLGALMNASHASLRDDFQVSSPELDAMVECGRGVRGCLGIRMTGAGFGGCAVALVRSAEVPEFVTEVADGYRATAGRAPSIYVCRASDGASVVG